MLRNEREWGKKSKKKGLGMERDLESGEEKKKIKVK